MHERERSVRVVVRVCVSSESEREAVPLWVFLLLWRGERRGEAGV